MKIKEKYNRLTTAQRLSHLAVPIIGLTGGIATGKSTVGNYLINKGYPLLNADLLIKMIYQGQETLDFISNHFPQVIHQEKIDFKKLRELFFHHKDVQTKVENFLYPRLEEKVVQEFKKLGNPEYLFYDVPLLYEKDMASHVDVTIVVYTSPMIQKERLIFRDKISEDLANQILSKQWPIDQKKALADFTIKNEGATNELPLEIERVLKELFN